MPLTGAGVVGINFEAYVDDFIADSKRVERQLENIKKDTQETNDALKRSAEQASQAAKKNRVSWTELSSAIGLAKQAYQVIGQVVDETFGTFQKYAGEIRDLSLITGTGAEATSRFVQVLDDYELTAGDAEAATRKLKEKGLVPTIDTLAMLADQYKKIKDPAERMAFIQDNLGRGGVKWVNVLNQEGDALREAAAQVDKNLILSDEMIAKAEQERLAIDALSDTWEGYKIQTGAALGEIVLATQKHNKALDSIRAAYEGGKISTREYIDAQHELSVGTVTAQEVLEKYQNTFTELNPVMQDYIAGEHEMYDATADTTTITEEQIEALEKQDKALQKSNASIISGSIDSQKALEDFNTKQSETRTKIEELQTLKATYYPWETEKIQETEDKIAELNDAYNKSGEEFVKASQTKIAQMAIEAIALSDGVAGFSQAEYLRAKVIAENSGLATAAAFDQTVAQQMLIDAVVAGTISEQEFGEVLSQVMADGVTSVNEVTAAIESIPPVTDVAINVKTNYSYSGANANPYTNGTIPGYAKGTDGWESVPSGYPNDSYPVMLQSGEEFAVRQKGESSSSGGSSVASVGAGIDAGMLVVAMTPVMQRFAAEISRSMRATYEKGGARK